MAKKKTSKKTSVSQVEDRHYMLIALVVIAALAIVYAYMHGLGVGIEQGMMGDL